MKAITDYFLSQEDEVNRFRFCEKTLMVVGDLFK